jgi:hypothetical protein
MLLGLVTVTSISCSLEGIKPLTAYFSHYPVIFSLWTEKANKINMILIAFISKFIPTAYFQRHKRTN